jgi:hypothetical protein
MVIHRAGPSLPDFHGIKGTGAMATFAAPAKTTIMDIILAVTSITCRRQADFPGRPLQMAGMAIKALVRAVEYIICLLIVVKLPQ